MLLGCVETQNRFNARWWPQLENHSVKVQMAGSTGCSECGPSRNQKACVGIKEGGRAMVWEILRHQIERWMQMM